VLFVLVAYRLLSPGSEWRLHREWFDQKRACRLARAHPVSAIVVELAREEGMVVAFQTRAHSLYSQRAFARSVHLSHDRDRVHDGDSVRRAGMVGD